MLILSLNLHDLPRMVPWILRVAPSNPGLKANLASITMPLSAKSRLDLGCFLDRNAQYQYCRQLQKGMPGSPALNLYLHVNSLSAILWRQMNRRPAKGAARPKYANRTPLSQWGSQNENKTSISEHILRKIMYKYSAQKHLRHHL